MILYHVRRAVMSDLEDLVVLEEACFPTPWPRSLLERDLQGEPTAVYLVAEHGGELVGCVAGWIYGDEMHVGSVATPPAWRRRGIAELLMLLALREAQSRGVGQAYLEYRVSNAAAAQLYAKLGFSPTRLRRRYYMDTGEDAQEVVLSDLQAEGCSASLEQALADWKTRRKSDFDATEL
jgi:ribosomal-protein-alanine N-acetyltransferase